MRRAALLLAAASSLAAAPASAATIWTGAPMSFTQTQPGDRDILLPGAVEITRDAFFGIYNAALESAYSGESPAGTLWAFPANNPGETIAAIHYAELVFAPWVEAIAMDPLGMLGEPAVLHLVESDVYLDVRFTQWGARGAGGFAYERSTVPEPGAGVLTLAGLIALSTSVRGNRPLLRRRASAGGPSPSPRVPTPSSGSPAASWR